MLELRKKTKRCCELIEIPVKSEHVFQKVAASFRAASGSKNRIPKKKLGIEGAGGGLLWRGGGTGGGAGVTPCLRACGRSEIRPVIGGMPDMVLLWSSRPVVHVASLSLASG